MRCSILIAAEEQSSFLDLEEQLGSTYQLFKAHESRRALSLAKELSPHAFIVAHSLSDKQGIDFIRDIKRDFPQTPIIFIAAKPTSNLILSAFRAGVDDFLAIPFTAKELTDALKRIDSRRNQWWANKDKNNSENPRSWVQLFSRLKAGLFEKPDTSQTAHSTKEDNQIANCLLTNGKSPNQPSIALQYFGPFKVTINDTVIKNWPGKKAKLLFAYLALQKRPVYRDVLMEKFWPDSDSYSARNCLNVTLHQVRSTLQACCEPCDFILYKNDCYQLNPGIELQIDVWDMLHHWRSASSFDLGSNDSEALSEYEAAAALYKGDFIEEELYEAWIEEERESLREIYLTVLDRLSAFYSLDGKPGTAITLCNTILQKDPYREDIHQRLMLCFERASLRDRAVMQFEKCKKALEELDLVPSQKTLSILNKIKTN